MPYSIDRLYEKLLVLRSQTGDNAAFEELVVRYSPGLRYFLAKMLGNDHADDALQEVWLDVFRGLGRLAEPAAFTTWIYRISRDRAYRQLRSQGRLQATSLYEAPVDVAEMEEEPEFSPEDAQQINQELERLPPDQREVLTLRFIEGMTYEEIAAVVGCPVGTVRSRIHYAKLALRRQLIGVLKHER
ncbi:MAG TPA: sigma-70 family RNA polymerase sigma factor [Pirellulales bacterium]|jgi:RNA polymerase sigma-70 factor (ECF subfamily)